MGTEYKSVRLTEEAYETLASRKRPDESFSETVRRLARERPIADLAGLFTEEEVEDARSAREAAYRTYAAERSAGSEE